MKILIVDDKFDDNDVIELYKVAIEAGDQERKIDFTSNLPEDYKLLSDYNLFVFHTGQEDTERSLKHLLGNATVIMTASEDKIDEEISIRWKAELKKNTIPYYEIGIALDSADAYIERINWSRVIEEYKNTDTVSQKAWAKRSFLEYLQTFQLLTEGYLSIGVLSGCIGEILPKEIKEKLSSLKGHAILNSQRDLREFWENRLEKGRLFHPLEISDSAAIKDGNPYEIYWFDPCLIDLYGKFPSQFSPNSLFGIATDNAIEKKELGLTEEDRYLLKKILNCNESLLAAEDLINYLKEEEKFAKPRGGAIRLLFELIRSGWNKELPDKARYLPGQ